VSIPKFRNKENSFAAKSPEYQSILSRSSPSKPFLSPSKRDAIAIDIVDKGSKHQHLPDQRVNKRNQIQTNKLAAARIAQNSSFNGSAIFCMALPV